MSSTTNLRGTSPHPRLVAGYAEAQRAGELPPVPTRPPTLAVSPTAYDRFVQWVILLVGGFVVLLVPAVTLGDQMSYLARVLVFLCGGLGWFVGVLALLARTGNQLLEELERGYVTLEHTMGGFWPFEGPGAAAGVMRAPWDYRGTWKLDHRTGAVLREPDRSIDPPGMYPSPHRPGARELWSGACWLGHYAD